MALVYTMNKTADKTHSCWAPVFIAMVEDVSDSVRTSCCLFCEEVKH